MYGSSGACNSQIMLHCCPLYRNHKHYLFLFFLPPPGTQPRLFHQGFTIKTFALSVKSNMGFESLSGCIVTVMLIELWHNFSLHTHTKKEQPVSVLFFLEILQKNLTLT